jgi:hypothetical protein
MFGNDHTKALKVLARAMGGHCEDKNWITYLGNRNSGKSVLYTLLETAFGNQYVKAFELENLLTNGQTSGDPSKVLYWTLDIEFCRLAMSQEIPPPNSGKKLNAQLLKKLQGGCDTIVARRNYDRKDTHFKTDVTIWASGNNDIEATRPDVNEQRIRFSSVLQFKSAEEQQAIAEQMRMEGESEELIAKVLANYREKDPSVVTRCKSLEWANALVYLLMQHYTDRAVAPDPPSLDDDNDTLLQKLFRNFEITKDQNDAVLASDVEMLLRGECKTKIKNELAGLGVIKKKSKVRGPTRDKQAYIGMKKLVDEEESQGTQSFL